MDEPRTYGRGYAWALVGVFTSLSVTLNGAHAALEMAGRPAVERVLAALVAVVAPVSLLLATELVVRLIRDWRARRRWLTVLRGACAATTAAIAIIAFATSAVALTRMATMMGVTPGLAWALPAVVDAMIVIATLAVVVAEAEMAVDRVEPFGELSGRAVQPDTGHPPLDTSTPSAEHLIRTAGQVSDIPPDTRRWTPAGLASETLSDEVSGGPHRTSDTGADQDEHLVDSMSDTPVQPDAARPHTAVQPDTGHPRDTLDTPSIDASNALSTEPSDTADEAVGDFFDLASRVIDEVGTTADAATVERALRLHLDGAGLRRIGDEVGRSRSTVSPWIVAAKRLDPTYGRAEATRPLEVVD